MQALDSHFRGNDMIGAGMGGVFSPEYCQSRILICHSCVLFIIPFLFVIPAHAGIHIKEHFFYRGLFPGKVTSKVDSLINRSEFLLDNKSKPWIPTFVGMTSLEQVRVGFSLPNIVNL